METNKTAAERRAEHRARMEEHMARFAGRTHPRREHARPAMPVGRTHQRREHPFMAHMRKKAEEVAQNE